MIKTTGAEWKAFNLDDKYWGEFCLDDEVITVNGERVDPYDFDPTKLADTDKVAIEGGWVADQAKNSTKEYSLATFFNRWRKTQTTEYLSVEVPKEKASAVRAAIIAAGGKVK
ncbi:hypothetical protein [Burkholderia glumae]|uniref:hypothetical protein n=1 Tax=Burkholderia glumae TaxID=337 RepID=UPI00214FF16A|nr:hypothetical protein [Burkholderia glumae]